MNAQMKLRCFYFFFAMILFYALLPSQCTLGVKHKVMPFVYDVWYVCWMYCTYRRQSTEYRVQSTDVLEMKEHPLPASRFLQFKFVMENDWSARVLRIFRFLRDSLARSCCRHYDNGHRLLVSTSPIAWKLLPNWLDEFFLPVACIN